MSAHNVHFHQEIKIKKNISGDTLSYLEYDRRRLAVFSLTYRYDIILDATDNVATRYLLNDACVLTGKPLVSGSALRFEGQVTRFIYYYEISLGFQMKEIFRK